MNTGIGWGLNIGFLLILGVLSFVALAIPGLVIFGLFLGIVPGIILLIAPTLFIYLTQASVVAPLVRGLRIKFAPLVSLILVVGFGCAQSFWIDWDVWEKYREAKYSEVPLRAVGGTFKSIAVLGDDGATPGNGDVSEMLCGSICQRLLYNGGAQEVMVAEPLTQGRTLNEAAQTAVFYIKKGRSCEEIGVTGHENSTNTLTLNGVSARMASGECLVKDYGEISEADAVLSIASETSGKPKYQDFWNINRKRLKFLKIELLIRNSEGKLQPASRFISLKAEPLFAPLTVAPIIGGSGGNLYAASGFVRWEIDMCNDNFCDTMAPTESVLNAMLGSYMSEPLVSESLDSSLAEMLNDPSAESERISRAFEYYLRDFSYGRKKQISSEDQELIILSLQDQRITGVFSNFDGVLQVLKKELKRTKIPDALIERIIIGNHDVSARDTADLISSLIKSGINFKLSQSQTKRLKRNAAQRDYVIYLLQGKMEVESSRDTKNLIRRMIENWSGGDSD